MIFVTTRARTGVSFIEVLIALLFMATAGMAIISSSSRNLQESAWGAEKVIVESLLNEMEQALRVRAYCDLFCELPRDEASVTQAHKDALDAFPPLAKRSYRPDPQNPGTIAEQDADPFVQEAMKAREVLKLERFVLFKETSPGNAQITCVVKYVSRAGPAVRSERKFAVFLDNLVLPCTPCP